MEKVFDVPKRERKPDTHHARKSDDLGSGFEIAEGVRIVHPARVGSTELPLKPFSSDNPPRFYYDT